MACCEKTITLTGTEQRVELEGQNCDLRNDGAGVVYISRCPGVEPDADGVVSVPPGQAVKYCGLFGAVYLLGEGKVLLCGNDYSTPVFRGATTSAGSGEGGVSQTYVDMQDANTLNKAKVIRLMTKQWKNHAAGCLAKRERILSGTIGMISCFSCEECTLK